MMDVHRRVEALTGVDVGSGDGGAQEDAEAADPVMGPAESLAAACNTNLQWGSACAVDAMPASAAGFHDVRGSAWEWCDDHFAALPGFKVRPSLSLSLHWLSLSLTVSPLALSLSHCLSTGSLSLSLSPHWLSLSLSLHWLSLSLTVSPLALSLSHCLSTGSLSLSLSLRVGVVRRPLRGAAGLQGATRASDATVLCRRCKRLRIAT
jgi:hypothetical protein